MAEDRKRIAEGRRRAGTDGGAAADDQRRVRRMGISGSVDSPSQDEGEEIRGFKATSERLERELRDARGANRKQQGELETERSQQSQPRSLCGENRQVTDDFRATTTAKQKLERELEMARSQLSQLEFLRAETQRLTKELLASIEARAELERGLQQARKAHDQQQRGLKFMCNGLTSDLCRADDALEGKKGELRALKSRLWK
jgi:chromosome segregation ATPase